MATRPRGSGSGGGAATPPDRTQQGSIWPAFEDFKPMAEWKQDNESHILTIDLPGFAKEQLRVSTEGRDVIRVRGERLVAGNKWSRFLEDYKVPINSDMNSVRAKFQEGILTITVRKKDAEIPHDVHPPQNTTADAPKQPAPQKGRVGSPQAPEGDETARLRKEHQGLPGVSRDERNSSPLTSLGETLAERKELNELKEKYAAPHRTHDATQKKESAETSLGEILAERKELNELKEKYAAPHRTHDATQKKESAETSKKLPAEEAAKKKKFKSTPDGAPPITSKTDENKNNKESKGKHTLHSTAADYGVLTVEKCKKAVKEYGELNEERKLLVNMGVAVLVVMAVTAYATYKFTSRKDQT